MIDIQKLSDEELKHLFEGVLTEIRNRSFEFRSSAQKVIDYCCRNKSLSRLKIGADEMKHFWRGFGDYWG